MKVLVLGGTGAMGQPLIKQLSLQGDDVYVTSRRKYESKDNIHFIQGDAHDLQFIKQQLRTEYDVIVDFMIYGTETFKERADLYLNATGQYMFLSSARVYAQSKEPIKEDSPRLLDVCKDKDYLRTDEYALAKARSEDILFNSEKNNWTIIRPYITYNIKRLQLGGMELMMWLNAVLAGKPLVLPRDVGQKETTMTYGNDVSRAMSMLVGNKEAIGEAFHITGTDHMIWSDVASVYRESIEEFTGMHLELFAPEDSTELSAVLGNSTQIKYDRLYDRLFDNSKLMRVCGKAFSFTPMRDGLKACIQAYLKLPEKQRINERNITYEAWLDRSTNRKASTKGMGTSRKKIKYLAYYYAPNMTRRALGVKRGLIGDLGTRK